MTQKSYLKGSAFPPLKKGTLRLYSMRFCPFAQRTRLVLAHKQIPYETINVHLKAKPQWFFEKNPLGKVPVLEHDDKIIYESDICDDYLEDVYPDKALNPQDPYVKARHRILKEHVSGFIGNYYKYLRSNGTDEEALTGLHRVLQILEENLGNQNFFGGDGPVMLDFHTWPWFERLDPQQHGSSILPEDKFPRMTRWVKNMWGTEAVKATAFDLQTYREFKQTYSTGTPNYDIGLSERTEKAFVKGEPFPELERDTLRLYSMRFCPFAQRTRLVLAHKHIPFETINLSLKEKPDWFLERNPQGKVPVLEINGQVLYESDVCCEYLENVYSDNPLSPKDPFVRARHNILKQEFSQWVTMFYRFLFSGSTDEEAVTTMLDVAEKFDKIVQGKTFFGGDQLTMLDYYMWPWFERVDSELFQGRIMPEGRFPHLRAWMRNMSQTEAVQATRFDVALHNEFYKGYAVGNGPFDLGLKG